MNKTVSSLIAAGLLVIGLAMLPAVGLPYGHFDWTVYSQAYGVLENLALNRPAFATTYLFDHPPSYAVDGDLDTTWESSPHHQQWLYVILDKPQWVNQVVINWGEGYATRYRISVVVDGRYGHWWQPVYDETSGGGDLDFVSFPNIYGSAVAISMFRRAPDAFNFSIREFEVFYLPEETQESENLAAGKSAYATSYQSGYEPSQGTDADMSTSWRPDPSIDPQVSSIYVDLDETYDVSQVDLYWGETYPDRYRLYAWTFVWSGWHGYWAWWPIHEGSSTGGQNTSTFSPISTRYVRLVAYSEAGHGVDLKEFEVYSGPREEPSDGNAPPSTGYLTPDTAKEGVEGVLRDLVPPGWEESPAWRQTPSEEGVPVPELLPPKSVPSIDQ